jgi:hypothetical protein
MKKINLKEKQLKKIFEDYRQLKLPFERGVENGYDYKSNYEHFIDWLEYIGKYGTLGSSGLDKNKIIKLAYSYLENAYNEYINSYDNGEQVCYSSISSLFKEAYKNGSINKYFNITSEIINNAIECDFLAEVLDTSDVIDYYDFLTEEGKKEFKKRCIEYLEFVVIEQGLINITVDNRGLIYVEREITIPDLLNTKFDDSYEPHQCSFFDYLRHKMKGVGICWSWENGGGEAYCANSFNGVSSNEILMVGWVNPKSVDWVDTLKINAYMENSETELRLLKGNVVEIDKIIFENKNMLNKPILVKT